MFFREVIFVYGGGEELCFAKKTEGVGLLGRLILTSFFAVSGYRVLYIFRGLGFIRVVFVYVSSWRIGRYVYGSFFRGSRIEGRVVG